MFLLYFILFLVLIYLSIWLAGRKYENPYKLIMIFGKKGSGKTTYFTKLALKYRLQGKLVYSNTPIYGTRLFSVEDFGKFQFPEDSVVLIDEVKLIWDSRDFKSFADHTKQYFVLQRHHKNTIYLASQQFNVDKTIRDLCDELYLLVNYCNIFSVAKKIRKKITIHNGDDEKGQESFLTEDYRFSPIWEWKITFIPHWVYYFNSFEKSDLKSIRYLQESEPVPWLEHISKGKNYAIYLAAQTLYTVKKNIKVPEIPDQILEKFKIKRKMYFSSNEINVVARMSDFFYM